jgi:hypothetical protein
MKRLILILTLVVLLAVALSACASAVTSAPAPTSAPAQAVAHSADSQAPTKAPTPEQPAATQAPATTAPTRLPPPTPVLTVATTLDGLTTLPHRIQWQALAPVNVTTVNFYIDGRHTWKWHYKVPAGGAAVYGDNGQYLVTSFLTPGEHRFEVRMLTGDGRVFTSVVTATVVAAPAPPDGLADTSWTREVTKSDVQKAISSQPPSTGRVGLSIDSVGWTLHPSEGVFVDAPSGFEFPFDVDYASSGQVELRPSIEKNPYPNDTGNFCDEPDPEILWSYKVGNGGKTLTLHPVGDDPCGDRVALLEGTWTRQTK